MFVLVEKYYLILYPDFGFSDLKIPSCMSL